MARTVAVLCLLAVLALTFTDTAQATIGKGGFVVSMGKGKGSYAVTQKCEDVCTDVCDDVCKDVCKDVPKEVCTEKEEPFQECKDVPYTSTSKKCEKVCKKVSAPAPAPVTYSKGKGKSIGFSLSFGKGRRLNTIGKGISIGKGVSYSKGKAPAVEVAEKCEDVCKDVTTTSYKTECKDKIKTTRTCETKYDKVCEKKCDKVCTKKCDKKCKDVPVNVKPQPVIVLSKGKGKWGH